MAKTLLLVGGHGAGDPGAAGNGTIEANETRRVNQALYNKLKGKIQVEIYNTGKDLYRTNDHGAYRNHEVIETHFNAFNGSARGMEVLIKSGFTPDALDNGLLKAMAKYFANRGIKQRSDLANMNKFASQGTSYRLIEVCFIDSGDMPVYNSKFDSLITDMANAILKVYGVSANAPVQPTTPPTKELYRVRKSWQDAKSQTGAYADLANAKKACRVGYTVFNSKGVTMYMPAQPFTPYKVRVDVTDLRIRSGAGTNHAQNGFTGKGVFTIVAESTGQGASKWGRLKGGTGWIALDFTKRI